MVPVAATPAIDTSSESIEYLPDPKLVGEAEAFRRSANTADGKSGAGDRPTGPKHGWNFAL